MISIKPVLHIVLLIYIFFDKKSTGSGFKKLKNMTKSMAETSALARSSSILANELHKPIIKKFDKKSIFAI